MKLKKCILTIKYKLQSSIHNILGDLIGRKLLYHDGTNKCMKGLVISFV